MALPEIPADAGRDLIPIARSAIAGEFGLTHPADATAPWLRDPGATFVTLTQTGRLRGCIGSLEAHRTLLADVTGNAVAAAFRDPRFPPLSIAEYRITEIEVSLLSASEPLPAGSEADALAHLRPGIDGLIFRYGWHRSTFLPQVWDQLPDPAEFLARLKQKAGLPASFWAEDVHLARYTVTKWKESELTPATTP